MNKDGVISHKELVRNMIVFICSRGNRNALECQGDNCKPMTIEEVIEFVRRVVRYDDDQGGQAIEAERIEMALYFGKRIGWAKNEP